MIDGMKEYCCIAILIGVNNFNNAVTILYERCEFMCNELLVMQKNLFVTTINAIVQQSHCAKDKVGEYHREDVL